MVQPDQWAVLHRGWEDQVPPHSQRNYEAEWHFPQVSLKNRSAQVGHKKPAPSAGRHLTITCWTVILKIERALPRHGQPLKISESDRRTCQGAGGHFFLPRINRPQIPMMTKQSCSTSDVLIRQPPFLKIRGQEAALCTRADRCCSATLKDSSFLISE